MAQLRRGYTFQDGSTGNSANLHQLVDGGGILPGAISEQASAAPADADSFLFNKGGILKKCNLSAIKATIPAGAAADVFALRKLGTDALMACAGNDTRLRNAITGVRVGQGTAIDKVAEAQDYTLAPVSISGGGATKDIDWTKGNVFIDLLTADRTYTFSNTKNGQEILVVVRPSGHTITWPTLLDGPPLLEGGIVYCVRFLKTNLGISAWVEDGTTIPLIKNIAGSQSIDWNDGSVFYDTLLADKTYTFSNAQNGQKILVVLKPQGHAITWPALLNLSPNIQAGNTTALSFEFVKTPLGFSGYLLNDELASIPLGLGTDVDWSKGDIFYDGLLADKTYTFSNATDGQSIQFIITRNGHNATFPASVLPCTVGFGTTYLHCFFTKTPIGITALIAQI